MKKRIISVLGLILIAMASRAQTAVTATVVDSDGTAWANGTWSAQYAAVPNYSAAVLDALTGQWISPNPVTGSLNGSGALSVNLVPTQYVFGPSRAAGNSPGVIFTVCPQIRGGACYQTAPIVISGSSQSVSAQVNAVIQAPRVFGLSATAEAYADAEVSALAGNMYLNLTSGTLRCYTSSWAACSSGGSGSVTSVALVGSGNLFNTSAGTAVTGAGTLNVDSQLLTQLANCLVAGPATGANAAPTCRALVNADFPNTLAPTISLANMTGLLSAQVTAALGYTPANCTAGTTANDCLQLSGGLVPVINLPQGSSSAAGALQCGSGTTCSGGSISVGASGGCMTPIVVTLGSAAASITAASIPGTCNTLVIDFSGQVASASTPSIEMQFNGDTAAHYDSQFFQNIGSGTTAGVADTAQSAFNVINEAWQGTGNTINDFTINVPGYALTALQKSYNGVAYGNNSTPAQVGFFDEGSWLSTAAITSVTLLNSSAANFIVGSTLTITGR